MKVMLPQEIYGRIVPEANCPATSKTVEDSASQSNRKFHYASEELAKLSQATVGRVLSFSRSQEADHVLKGPITLAQARFKRGEQPQPAEKPTAVQI